MIISQNRVFFFWVGGGGGLLSYNSLFGQANMPWLSQNANGGRLGFCCSPMGDALALAAYLSRGGLAHRGCLEHGCVALP